MADITVSTDPALDHARQAGTGWTTVWKSTTVGYKFFVNASADDFVYVKTTDGGQTWGSQVTVRTGNMIQCAVWADWWTEGDSGTTIHTVCTDQGVDDVLYRGLDTATDTLGTETTVFAGATASTLGGPRLSITKARGGNLYVAYNIDGTAEHGFARSTDAGGTWGGRTDVFEGAPDQVRLIPAYTSDTQDVACIFFDQSAAEVSIKMHDDSGNSWTEKAITAVTITEIALLTASPQFAVSVRWSDDLAFVALWTQHDNVASDLKCYTVTLDNVTASSLTVTEKTNLITDKDDVGTACMTINQNSGRVYVGYIGNASGAESFGATVTPSYQYTDDSGGTWSGNLAYGETADDYVNMDADHGSYECRWEPCFYENGADDLFVNYGNSIAITAAVGSTTRRYSLGLTGVG